MWVKKRPDEFAIKFYSVMQNNEHLKWKQELDFLSQVDEYRFTKYFLIPQFIPIIKLIKNLKNVTDLAKIEELESYTIGLNENTMFIYYCSVINVNNSYLLDQDNMLTSVFLHYFDDKFSMLSNENLLAQPFIKDIQKTAHLTNARGKMCYEISLLDLVKITESDQDVLDIVKKNNNLFLQYKKHCIFVENENKKNELLNF